MSSYPATERYSGPRDRGSGALAGAIVLLLGLALGALVLILVVVAQSADKARDDAAAASAQAASTGHDHAAAATANTSLPLTSFAGKAAPNAAALAEAHAAYPAALPRVPAGDFVRVNMTLKDMTIEIAPGVRYNSWAFDGHGAPGPIVHAKARPSR
jgi:nitrite reductase (NO-forming)